MNYPNIIKEFQEFQANLINLIYPIGSIYMSVNNVSPQVFLGGSWEQIQDTFLLSAGSKHSAGSTGGEETHTLSVAETPAHTHTATSNSTGTHHHNVYVDGNFCAVSTGNINTWKQMLVNVDGNMTTNCSATHSSGEHSHIINVGTTGFGESHNNMPPYLTVYMWKRIS